MTLWPFKRRNPEFDAHKQRVLGHLDAHIAAIKTRDYDAALKALDAWQAENESQQAGGV